MDLLGRDVGDGQQQVDDPRLVWRGGIAGEQELDVVIVQIVDTLDGFADEGLDVGRVLANGRHQGFGGNFFRPFDGHAVAEDRALDLGFFPRIALGQHQAVVQGLVAAGAACRPGDLAVAVDTVDAHPVVIGDEAFIEAHIVATQGRHEHLHLDRVLGAGDELDLGVDVPEVIGLVLGNRDAEDEDLIGRDQNAQRHQDGNQDFQMKGKRAHWNYSAI
ncbi:hypothetical protein D3C76_676070 [compost metagenome]